MADEERNIKIGWNKHDEFLKNFYLYYTISQNLFQKCRADRKLLVVLFDNIHEVYRQMRPYMNESERRKMVDMHDTVKKHVDLYASMNDKAKGERFGVYFYEIDDFLSELTEIAVKKNFFPNPSIQRSAKEIGEAVAK